MLRKEFNNKVIEVESEHGFGSDYPLAQLSLLAFVGIIFFASLTPFNFQSLRLSPFAWMTAPLPRYIPFFDVEVNILGYLPFGFLCFFAIYPKLLKFQAFLWTVFFGMLLSGSLETLQTFLPSRVANLIDWYANVIGTLLGALIAILCSPTWLKSNPALRLRYEIFGKHRSFFLLLLLFPVAQIFPQNVWLGMGDFNIAQIRISPFWSTILNNTSQEIFIAMLAVFSTSAFLMFGTYRQTPQIRMMVGIIFLGVSIKIAMSQLQYGSYGIQSWLSLANIAGIFLGLMGALVIQQLSKKSQWHIALWGLITLVILSNLLPPNPYHLSQLQLLPQGRLTHFNGLLEWLSMVWPLLAIGVLLRDRHLMMHHQQME